MKPFRWKANSLIQLVSSCEYFLGLSLSLGSATNAEIERLMSLPSNLALRSSDTVEERDVKAVRGYVCCVELKCFLVG